MNTNDLQAQIQLLEDPDDRIYQMIRTQLVEQGEMVIPILEKSWGLSSYPIVNQRIETIIHDINFQSLLNEAQEWASKGGRDLLQAQLLISRFFFENLNIPVLISDYEKLKNEIWLEINDNLTALEKIGMLNHIFFKTNQFRLADNSKDGINAYLLSETITRKSGNDMGLGLLYLNLAMDLGMPIYGVDLPGNFILAYLDVNQDVHGYFDENNILFYVNPANKGVVFGLQNIETYLKQIKLEKEPHFTKPSSTFVVLKRLVHRLKEELKKNNETEKILELDKLSEVLFLNSDLY